MSGSTRYSPELRERAVRMAIENRADYKSEWATFVGVSSPIGSVTQVQQQLFATNTQPSSVTDLLPRHWAD